MSDSHSTENCAHWPGRLAWVLACATFPLVWVGGLVTTTDAGMAVPDWPSTYGYNLFLYPWQTWLAGPWDLFIEHGHRLLASAVGLLTIALAAILWRYDGRRWLRNIGLLAVLLVILQGMLGGMRVVMSEPRLAMIHGITGPLFFAVVVALVVFTSATWRAPKSLSPQPAAVSLHALALLTVAAVFVQLALGAVLRHFPVGASAPLFATIVQFHLLLAGILALQTSLLAWRVWRLSARPSVVGRLSFVLMFLVFVQIGLGAATWAAKYSVAQWVSGHSWLASYTIHAQSWLQTHIVTAHVAVGSLLLGIALALALFTMRLVPAHPVNSTRYSHLLEVAL